MFFGCRRREEDFLFQEELEGMEKEGICEVVCAFSREMEEKVYVQDKVRERGEEVMEMVVGGGGRVFVCGFVFSFFLFSFLNHYYYLSFIIHYL